MTETEHDEENQEEIEEVGIPQHLRIRRTYTMSEAALKQRQDAATSPKKAEGMQGNQNAWKHGLYSKNHIERYIRPCKSTCKDYPCSIVEEGATHPGEKCLDKQSLLQTYTAIIKAVKNNEFDDLNELMALDVAGAKQVISMLIEDILRDGSILKSEKWNKDGKLLGHEIVAHPSLHNLSKMLDKVGVSLKDMNVTPRAREMKEEEDKGFKAIADMMSNIGKGFKKSREKGDDDTGS